MPYMQQKTDINNGSNQLPAGFVPTGETVIIGRAKEAKESIGNRNLREIAQSFLPKYSNAKSRRVKSQVVSQVVALIREACPAGVGFVKKKHQGNGSYTWVQVPECTAREKVGYMFRDLLGDRYRSSSKSKSALRLKSHNKRALTNSTKTEEESSSNSEGEPLDCDKKQSDEPLESLESINDEPLESSIQKISASLFYLVGDRIEMELEQQEEGEEEDPELGPHSKRQTSSGRWIDVLMEEIAEEIEMEQTTEDDDDEDPQLGPHTAKSQSSGRWFDLLMEEIVDEHEVDDDDDEDPELHPQTARKRSSELWTDLMREEILDVQLSDR